MGSSRRRLRSLSRDHLRPEQADDRFCQCIVVRVSGSADGSLNATLSQALAATNDHVSRSTVTMMNESLSIGSRMLGVLQGIQQQIIYTTYAIDRLNASVRKERTILRCKQRWHSAKRR